MRMKKNPPVIGFTLDHNKGSAEQYSRYPWYAIRENYLTSVSEFNAIPLPLPYELSFVDAYLSRIDALLITGGDFDIPPHYYGQSLLSDTVSVKETRTAFELAMTRGALERNMPVLGICGGQQLLAVALGSTLIQHIPDTIENPLAHEQPNPRHEVGHSVTIKPNTQLREIVGAGEIMVNSAHHQAVERLGDGLILNAVASDGVIEGMECRDHRFCIGVQWHPEFLITEYDRKLMQAFVKAAEQKHA